MVELSCTKQQTDTACKHLVENRKHFVDGCFVFCLYQIFDAVFILGSFEPCFIVEEDCGLGNFSDVSKCFGRTCRDPYPFVSSGQRKDGKDRVGKGVGNLGDHSRHQFCHSSAKTGTDKDCIDLFDAVSLEAACKVSHFKISSAAVVLFHRIERRENEPVFCWDGLYFSDGFLVCVKHKGSHTPDSTPLVVLVECIYDTATCSSKSDE